MSIFIATILILIPILLLLLLPSKTRTSKRVPPGSLGIPIIGQSIGYLRCLRSNTAEKWLQERVQRYGPISKLGLFGKPTVFIYGQAANKFVFNNDGSKLSNQQPQSVKMILGERNLLELSGHDHRRIRNAIVNFLKPESLKQYVGKMDGEVRSHLDKYWQGKQQITVMPLMKTLTFDMICSLLFGLERGKQREELLSSFTDMVKGGWSVPLNLPFTTFNRSLKDSANIGKMVKGLIQKRRTELERNTEGVQPQQHDLITSMLKSEEVITEEEIIHNVKVIMVAGHDTTAVLLTFIIQLLANEPGVYEAVLQEQEEIAKSKLPGEPLTWEDLAKMKYTWRVAMETLRLVPPVFGGFRKATTDIEYEGYLIPKGWQVLWVTGMTHMDNSIFPEATMFDPSRFENQAAIPPYCFIPFGAGPRICPGNEFAKIETLVAVHYMVTRFTWKLCSSDNFFSREPMPAPTQGLPVQVFARKQS